MLDPSSPLTDPPVKVPEAPGSRVGRLFALDALRGILMILMALDHANVFIAHEHPGAELWMGPSPWHASALAFLTRFVTHLAAPGFFFLMGSGMILFADARAKLGWSRSRIARHFVLRGALLILLQFVVENPAWPLSSAGRPLMPWGNGPVYVGVLFGLGTTMIVGSLFLGCRTRWLVGMSTAAILVTQTIFPAFLDPHVQPAPWLQLLLIPGQSSLLLVYYPVVPWLGVLGAGMIFGRWLLDGHALADRHIPWIGALCVTLFLGVRFMGGWGNIHPDPGGGWMSFLYVVKYPPSLAFLLLTLGVDLLLLSALTRAETWVKRWGAPLLVFGSNPLFFYLLHLYVYGLIGLRFFPAGTGIPRMLPYWLGGLILLYPMCRWYGRLKR